MRGESDKSREQPELARFEGGFLLTRDSANGQYFPSGLHRLGLAIPNSGSLLCSRRWPQKKVQVNSSEM